MYNNLFAFTSTSATTTTHGVTGGGPLEFQIQGALYHYTGSLNPLTNRLPQFAQLYFYDPDIAASYRALSGEGLDAGIIADLTASLQSVNPFIQIYRTARERFYALTNPGRLIVNPQMRLVFEHGADRCRENLPTANEIAVVIPTEYNEPCFRDVVLAERGATTELRRIHPHHAMYLPAAYPLMFPHGDNGYHLALTLRDHQNRGRKNNRMGFRQWCRYILHTQPGNHLIPFAFGRLFQQVLVDLWASCDQLKLDWLSRNQGKLRSDVYNGVVDWIRQGDGNAAELGRRKILPSGYVGGERFTTQCDQDSMAVMRCLGVRSGSLAWLESSASATWSFAASGTVLRPCP